MARKLKELEEMKDADVIAIDKDTFARGEHGTVKLNVGKTPSDTTIFILAHVHRAPEAGPTVLLLGGVHGDEINGIEIVSQMEGAGEFEDLKRGTVIAIPLLNVFGFNAFSREVPDGKDVNRSFPGSTVGSLASRIARTLTKKILPFVDIAIDLHTGGASRYNYPQIRYSGRDSIAAELAHKFAPPYIIQQSMIPKSFRKVAFDLGIHAIVFEGGESVRLDGYSIEKGKEGITRILNAYGMMDKELPKLNYVPQVIQKTSWLRARQSGVFIWSKSSGSYVHKNEPIGIIKDPFGTKKSMVISKVDGMIIGHNNASVVNQGDALFHIGLKDDWSAT